MPGNFKGEDLRILKTRKALFNGLLSTLKRKDFCEIIVHDICTEALVSRTAFYAHFRDKYHLLEAWLQGIKKQFFLELQIHSRAWAEERITRISLDHFTAIAHLLKDADLEQRDILLRFLTPCSDGDFERGDKTIMGNRALRDDFLAGGMLAVLSSRIKKKQNLSEEQIKSATTYVYGMIRAVLDWDGAPANGGKE